MAFSAGFPPFSHLAILSLELAFFGGDLGNFI